jgi:hypothetical protein
MSRAQIIALSVVCCAFGALSLWGPDDLRTASYVVNVALAIACFLVAGRDLTRRGWQLGYLFAGAYLLPLIGLIVYVGLSNRPQTDALSPSAT